MLKKRYRHYAAWASLMALTNGCSDDSSGNSGPTNPDASQDAAFMNNSSDERTSSDDAASDPGLSDANADTGSPTSETSDAAVGTTERPTTLVDATVADGGAPGTSAVDSSAVDSGAVDTVADVTSTVDGGRVATDADATDPVDSGVVDPEAAKAFFWETFTAQRIDDGTRASQLLESALGANPGDANLALLVAHSYLWRLSEFARSTTPDPSQLPALAGAAEAGFARAYAQAPNDARISGWLGSVMVGNGGATGDAEKLEAGHALVGQGVAAYPEFNGFVQSLVNASYPVGSPQFDLALEAMWDNLDVCAGFTTDREEPNVRQAVEAVLQGGADPACANTLRAAHNLEGFFLYFGDILVKANRETAARAMYDATRASPTFDLWPYRDTLTQRELDVTARLAAYANEDPSDDPALVAQEVFNCSYCHAAAPEEPFPDGFAPLR
jgi:hypothetical protein